MPNGEDIPIQDPAAEGLLKSWEAFGNSEAFQFTWQRIVVHNDNAQRAIFMAFQKGYEAGRADGIAHQQRELRRRMKND